MVVAIVLIALVAAINGSLKDRVESPPGTKLSTTTIVTNPGVNSPTKDEILDLSFLNPTTGYALLSRPCGTTRCAVVESTLDGGTHWKMLGKTDADTTIDGIICKGVCADHVTFVSTQVGYLFGSSLLETNNGGQS